MKILLTGGSGLLGKVIQEILQDDPNIQLFVPTHDEMDITVQGEVMDAFSKVYPDIVIHAAAMTDNRVVEQEPGAALVSNIFGTSVIAMTCRTFRARMVYISTDYVYKGDRGNYRESDELLPFNLYAWTKLGGECAVRCVENHLIIRTTFGSNQFPYKIAFTDKYSSKDYVDVIAPKIIDAAISPMLGVVNIGTERKTLFDYAKRVNPKVMPVKLKTTYHRSPVDTSMNLEKYENYKSGTEAIRHVSCRCCGNESLEKYLDLGCMPLANNLEPTADRARNVDHYPLQVLRCPNCGLSQLSVVISPTKMFSYYVYRSGINAGYIKHCARMAENLLGQYALTEPDLHIDIAGNDGTLLKQFSGIIPWMKRLNVDPAENLCTVAELQGVPSLVKFWGTETVRKHIGEKQAKLITATNVFAHVDDIQDFLEACKMAMKPRGVTILEFPYIGEFLAGMEFDTVYFEHLSYMGVYPIHLLCEQLGLEIINLEMQNIHGGTMRVHIASKGDYKVLELVPDVIQKEKRLVLDKDHYKNWAEDVNMTIDQISTQLLHAKQAGVKIAGFAASAKGNTLLNSCGITTDIVDYIVDETPEKVGRFSPGTGIPIVGPTELMTNPPDVLIILSWNFAEDIIKKCREQFNYKGKFFILSYHCLDRL